MHRRRRLGDGWQQRMYPLHESLLLFLCEPTVALHLSMNLNCGVRHDFGSAVQPHTAVGRKFDHDQTYLVIGCQIVPKWVASCRTGIDPDRLLIHYLNNAGIARQQRRPHAPACVHTADDGYGLAVQELLRSQRNGGPDRPTNTVRHLTDTRA
jgi:hypothetical protein